MMKAWVDKETGEIRIFFEEEELEGFGPDTHDLIDCPQEMLDGTHDWDAATRSCVTALSGARERVAAKVARCMAGAFLAGFPAFGDRLQVRDVEDRTNWLTSQAAYTAQVAAGNGAAEGASFRTMSNQTVVVSYQEGLATLLGMAAWGAAIMQRSWALKDAIASATSLADLEEIDVEAGW